MKKLFISQPMRDKTDGAIMLERQAAIEAAKEAVGEDVEVLETFFSDFNGQPLEFIGKSIEMLAQADIAYFAPGWQKARGCKIEHQCAAEYGVKIIECPGKRMTNDLFAKLVKEKVRDYTNEHLDKTDGKQITTDDVFIVWYCKTLQNWKAMASTTISDGMYYELTLNGDKHEVYLDAYKKFENRRIEL